MPSDLAVFSDTVTVLEMVAVVLPNGAVLLRRCSPRLISTLVNALSSGSGFSVKGRLGRRIADRVVGRQCGAGGGFGGGGKSTAGALVSTGVSCSCKVPSLAESSKHLSNAFSFAYDI